MKATSLPNLNHEPTSYHNFFSFFQDPNHHDDTTLHKRPNIDHSQVTEPSETSPFKGILSPLVSFNGSNENHYPVGGYFDEWDQNQMDQTLPRLPPSPTRSYDTTVSVGSNPFSGNVGARSEGPNFTQLRWDQTLPNTSSVGSAQLSGNVRARSEGPNVTQLRGDQTQPSMSSVGSYQSSGNVGARSEGPNYTQLRWDQTLPSMSSVGSYQSSGNVGARSAGPNFSQLELPRDKRRRPTETWTTITSNFIDDGHAWRKYAQKLILNFAYPRSYFRCAHKFDQGCLATKQVQKTNDVPPMYQTTYHGNHSCGDPTKAPHIILDSTIPNDGSNSNIIDRSTYNYNPLNNISKVETMGGFENCFPGEDLKVVDWDLEEYKQSGDTSNLIDDGHEWRMYAKWRQWPPRNYFRCTHKFDQACPATKQVQRTDENPPMFQTTYHGDHTCRNPPAPHLIGESVPLDANC